MDDGVFFKGLANVKALQLVLKEHEGIVEDLVGIEVLLLELWTENKKVQDLEKELLESKVKFAGFVKYVGVE